MTAQMSGFERLTGTNDRCSAGDGGRLGQAWRDRDFPPSRRRAFYLALERGLRSGVPIVAHLNSIAAMSGGRQNTQIRKMIDVLSSGGLLHQAALAASPLFPGPAPALICAAERTGEVADALNRLSESMTFEVKVRRRVLAGFAYPLVLLLSAAFVLPLPKLISCGSGAYLGAAARTLVPLFVLVLLLGMARLALLLPGSALVAGRLREALPLLGRTFRLKALAVTLSTLGQGLEAGLSLFEALSIARMAAGSATMTRLCDDALASVRDGAELATAFSSVRAIPDEIAVVLATGEKTGRLPEALATTSRELFASYTRRIQAAVVVAGALLTGAVMIWAAFTIISTFSSVLNLGGAGGFNPQIQREIPGLFQDL